MIMVVLLLYEEYGPTTAEEAGRAKVSHLPAGTHVVGRSRRNVKERDRYLEKISCDANLKLFISTLSFSNGLNVCLSG
jgi:hypothetical protein